MQEEIAATPGLGQGGVLILDESADAKAGEKSAGSGRQYNGRLGKVDMSQVGTFLAYANGLSFEAICCDDFYGQSSDFRAEMKAAEFIYMADVPHNTQVYLKRPVVGVPEAKPGKHGRKPSRSRVLSPDKPLKVSDVARREGTNWRRVRVRDTERGELNDEFAARRV